MCKKIIAFFSLFLYNTTVQELKKSADFNTYDTSINVIGGLKDCSVIYKAIESYFNENDSVHDLIGKRNEFNLRTDRSRTRIESAIRSSFLSFKNKKHQELFKELFSEKYSISEKELFLFWQFSLSNRLFREISTNVFLKTYFSGRIGLSKDDIIAYLKDFLSRNKKLKLDWSENTIETIATKYLNFMIKLNLLEGTRIKTFRHVRMSAESLVIFLYIAKLQNPKRKNILKNEILSLSFIPAEDIPERLKKLSMKDYFKFDYNGVSLNIELIHNFKGICDVLYNRT